MIEYLITIIIGLLALGYIFLVQQPKKKMLWYKNTYEKLGYKVKVCDFQLLKLGIFHDYIAWEKKYDDSFYMLKQEQFIKSDVYLNYLVTGIQITLFNPDLIKHWAAPDKVNSFKKNPQFTKNVMKMIGGFGGILFSDGDIWKKKRKTMTKCLNHQLVKNNIQNMSQICDQVLDRFQKDYYQLHPSNQNQNENQNHLEMNISNVCLQMFCKIIFNIFFGSHIKDHEIEGVNISNFAIGLLIEVVQQTLQIHGIIFGRWIHDIGLTQLDRSINRRKKILNQFALIQILEKIQSVKLNGFKENSCDLLEKLLNEQSNENKNKPFEQRFNSKQLIQDFLTFILVGTQSSSSMTKAMIYILIKNPRVQKKLRQQIDKFIHSQNDINWDNLKKLQYLEWIQTETLRMKGPFNNSIPQIAVQDVLINNLPIKKGDCIDYASTPVHHNSQFFKDPFEFRPQRWESECKNNHPFSFVSFSSGPRSCVGKSLALLQNKIIIVKFLKRYQSLELLADDVKFRVTVLYEAQDFSLKMTKTKR